jgi:hypothetical protein
MMKPGVERRRETLVPCRNDIVIEQGRRAMATLTKLPKEQLAQYFDRFTKRFLRDASPEAADVEVFAPEIGDQQAVRGARLYGVTYDTKSGALELAFEHGDHRIYSPVEVWVGEEPDGFVSSIELERSDGARELVSLRHVGLRQKK